jgi:hypothetical protein
VNQELTNIPEGIVSPNRNKAATLRHGFLQLIELIRLSPMCSRFDQPNEKLQKQGTFVVLIRFHPQTYPHALWKTPALTA